MPQCVPEYTPVFADDELMNGEDWIWVNMHGAGLYLFIRRGTRTYSDEQVAAMLADALAAHHLMLKRGEPLSA